MFLIVRTFFFNVGKLSVKLIGFRLLGFVKVAVFVHGGFCALCSSPNSVKPNKKGETVLHLLINYTGTAKNLCTK